jgi:nucleotide-binding universal stress UspA family protein
MKKMDNQRVLCPIDFSEVSTNAIEYAAGLTRSLHGRLTFLYVRTSIWPEARQLEKETHHSDESITEWFAKIEDLVKKEFGISSDHIIQSTTDTFEEVAADFSERYDLIVMGSHGADNLYKYFLGSNSFHLVEKSKCPVVVVPQSYLYQPVKQIIYAYDPETNPIFLVDQLKRFAGLLHAAVCVLHISPHELSGTSDLRRDILEKAVLAREPKGIDWSFDYQNSKDVVWELNKYLRDHKADMLALSFHHHSLMEQVRGGDIVKEICATAEFPIFVLWH